MTVLHRIAPAAPTATRPAATARQAVRSAAAGLVRALRKAGADAALADDGPASARGPVHLHAGTPAEALAGRLARGGHDAAVVHLWDHQPAATRPGWAARLALHGVADVAVPCACQQQLLAAAGASGTLHVVPAGVDLREHAPPTVHEREEARARLGLPAPGTGAVALVRDAPGAASGLAVALDALERVPGLQLLVPVPPEGGKVRELVAARGPLLAARVRFVAAAQPALLHAAADLAVLPWRTGDGLPCHPADALAAMAAGLPVVASATGCLPELLPHGRAALLVEPGDHMDLVEALSRLAADEPLRRALGQGARAAAEASHDADAVARKVAALYAKTQPGAAPIHTDVPVRFAA